MAAFAAAAKAAGLWPFVNGTAATSCPPLYVSEAELKEGRPRWTRRCRRRTGSRTDPHLG
ncbi:hypothetical protein SHIRM173S_08331 [Streptomyces hirsutus]